MYPFAGEIRSLDVSKNGFLFAPIANMGNSLKELDRMLADETPCSGMEKERLVKAVARVHAELLLIHPFREGNGRVARWIANLMALQAGFPLLQWGFEESTEESREGYFLALRKAYAMDFKLLELFVNEALERALRFAEDPHDER